VKLQLIDAAGDPISGATALEATGEGSLLYHLTPPVERFRVLVTGTDESALPFQRVQPVLFRVKTK
jgi:hypothetical protein